MKNDGAKIENEQLSCLRKKKKRVAGFRGMEEEKKIRQHAPREVLIQF
jgi:hypothetical protein